jgi:hypothetical protein
MQLELSAEERATLEQILARTLGDLREEVYKSDLTDYKAELRQREKLIHALLERVQAGEPTALAPPLG